MPLVEELRKVIQNDEYSVDLLHVISYFIGNNLKSTKVVLNSLAFPIMMLKTSL